MTTASRADRMSFAGMICALFWALEWAEEGDAFTSGLRVGSAYGWKTDICGDELLSDAGRLIESVTTVCKRFDADAAQSALSELNHAADAHRLVIKRSETGKRPVISVRLAEDRT